MKIEQVLEKRRSYYNINKELLTSEEEVIRMIEEVTELVPDAFDMKSARVSIVLGEKQEQLWDSVYEVFDGAVAREKIDSFRAGAGTVLFFYDRSVVEALQEQFPLYADHFPVWANQANGMLQLAVWCGLRELGIGASLQHYNPVINEAVRKLVHVPDNYVLVAQMPFGGIVSEPKPKDKEDITKRVSMVS